MQHGAAWIVYHLAGAGELRAFFKKSWARVGAVGEQVGVGGFVAKSPTKHGAAGIVSLPLPPPPAGSSW